MAASAREAPKRKWNPWWRALVPGIGISRRSHRAVALNWEETMSLFKKMTWMGAVAGLALSWAGNALADSAADTAV